MLAFWGDRDAGLASLSWAGLEFGEGAFTSREPRTRRLVGEEFMAAEGQRRVCGLRRLEEVGGLQARDVDGAVQAGAGAENEACRVGKVGICRFICTCRRQLILYNGQTTTQNAEEGEVPSMRRHAGES